MRNNDDTQTSSGGGSSGSVTRRAVSAEPAQSTPIGVSLIVIFGVIGSLLAVFFSLSLFQYGSGAALLGVVLIGLALAQVYVLLGLIALKSWAHTWALVLYGINLLFQLLTGNLIGVFISGLIVAYLLAKSQMFTE